MENDCIFAINNPHYPYEGYVTKSMCLLKPTLELICDKETNKGCELYNAMKENEVLENFLKNWIK